MTTVKFEIRQGERSGERLGLVLGLGCMAYVT